MLHQWWTWYQVAKYLSHDGPVAIAKKQLRKQNYLPKTNFISCICRADHMMNKFQTHNSSFQQSWTVNHRLQRHTQQVERYCTTVLTHSNTVTNRTYYCIYSTEILLRDGRRRRVREQNTAQTSSQMASQSLNIITNTRVHAKRVTQNQPEWVKRKENSTLSTWVKATVME